MSGKLCLNCSERKSSKQSQEQLCKPCLRILERKNCYWCLKEYHQLARDAVKSLEQSWCPKCEADHTLYGEPTECAETVSFKVRSFLSGSRCSICNNKAVFSKTANARCRHCTRDVERCARASCLARLSQLSRVADTVSDCAESQVSLLTSTAGDPVQCEQCSRNCAFKKPKVRVCSGFACCSVAVLGTDGQGWRANSVLRVHRAVQA